MEPDPARPDVRVAIGRLKDFDPARYLSELPQRFYLRYHRELQVYLSSLVLARDDAGLDFARERSDRVGLYDGTSRANFEFWYERIRREATEPVQELYTRRDLVAGLPGETVGLAASLFKLRGPAYLVNATCSSGAMAIGHGYRDIVLGEIDVAFATGHDLALTPPLFAMYRDANLISDEAADARRAVRPYVGYSTNAFGEGAVTVVLEEEARARARGATLIARVGGYKHGNNGYHPTTVDVAGVRPAQVIADLLSSTGATRESVAFVVGHGNAVHLSDVSEENYMRTIFGPRAVEVPLVSTKPIYGHTLGASSAVNVAAAALMCQQGYVIPTINIDETRLKRATNHQANRGVARTCEAGLAVSYGMGGHNTAVLVQRVEP